VGVVEILVLCLAAAAAVFALQWDLGVNLSDEGFLWYGSQRTLAGEACQRDFYGYDPGRYYWSAMVFRILGADGLPEQRAANALFGLLGLTAAGLMAWRNRWPRPVAWGLVGVLAFQMGYPQHKAYEQALSLAALWPAWRILTAPRMSSLAWAGLATGLAVWMGRNHGFYFLLIALSSYAFATWRRGHRPHWSEAGGFLCGLAAGAIPHVVFFGSHPGAWEAMLRSLRGSEYVQNPLPVPWPWRISIADWGDAASLQMAAVSLLCVLVPLVYGAMLWRGWRRKEAFPVAAALAGLAYLHHAFDRADLAHIAQGILPWTVCVAWFLAERGRALGPRRTLWSAVAVLGLILVAWTPIQPLWLEKAALRSGRPWVVQSISGRDLRIQPEQALLLRTAEETFELAGRRDGCLLTVPHLTLVYPLLHTRAPTWESYYISRRSPDTQARLVGEMIHWDTRAVLLQPEAAVDGREELKFRNAYPILWEYIRTHYALASRPGLPSGLELYLRKAD
jgi:hypothetical protein